MKHKKTKGDTHWCCNRRLKSEGPDATCCECDPHNECGVDFLTDKK